MTDYSKLSDYEISKRIARVIGGFCEEDFCEAHSLIFKRHGRFQYSFFEPCNNPADAWPIIVESKITVHAPMKYDEPEEWLAFDVHDSDIIFKDKNPLRAAMIVFLMMQEV